MAELIGGSGYDDVQSAAPTSPSIGDTWLDTSTDPPQGKIYADLGSGGQWTTDLLDQPISEAGASATDITNAVWSDDTQHGPNDLKAGVDWSAYTPDIIQGGRPTTPDDFKTHYFQDVQTGNSYTYTATFADFNGFIINGDGYSSYMTFFCEFSESFNELDYTLKLYVNGNVIETETGNVDASTSDNPTRDVDFEYPNLMPVDSPIKVELQITPTSVSNTTQEAIFYSEQNLGVLIK